MDVSESGREPLALRIFRHTGKVALESAGGGAVEGRGVISALRRETGEPGGRRHPLGELPRPLYRFVGWLPDGAGAEGGVISQGGARYRVLDARPILLGERQAGVRALLEREVKTDDDGK